MNLKREKHVSTTLEVKRAVLAQLIRCYSAAAKLAKHCLA